MNQNSITTHFSSFFSPRFTGVLKHFPGEVLNGKDYLEVRPAGVNKGVMLERIYKRLQATGTKSSKSKKSLAKVSLPRVKDMKP